MAPINRSRLQVVYSVMGIALFIAGLYVAYEATISWIATPSQWNEGIVVAILVILLFYGSHEYLHL